MIISTLAGQIRMSGTERDINIAKLSLLKKEVSRHQKVVCIWRQADGSKSCAKVAHTVLDCVGLVPIFGKTANLINAGWYAVEGDYKNAGLSVLSAVPGIGKAAKATKFGLKGIDAAIAITKPTRSCRKLSR